MKPKNISRLARAGILGLVLIACCAVQDRALAAGVVSLWHGDGNAQDAVGSNHGTLMGGLGFGPGVMGQGFLMDGVNDYVRVPDSPSLHFSNEMTLEMWVKREDNASEGVLIDKRNLSNCNFGFILSTIHGAHLYYNDGSGFKISFAALPSAGVFHHIAGSLRQVDATHVELKIYLDGQLAQTDTLPGNLANTFNGTAMAIGSGRDGVDGFFRGVIDEVAIYDYALNAAQINANYTNVTVTPPPPPPPPATPAVVSLWHGDGDAQDAVGSNHGTLMGGLGFGPGVMGQGFLMDGVNDYVRVPDSPSLHFSNEMTLEMWVKREDNASEGVLIDKRNLSNCNFGFILSTIHGAHLYYNDGSGFKISFAALPSAGVFHHIAGSLRQVDATHVELKIYLDGQLAQTDTLPGNLANTFNGTAMAIGSGRDGVDGFFRGVIDEVAIYNYALSGSQVLSNFSSVTPPPPPPPPPPTVPAIVSLWHGDGDAQDAVGTNHGTLMGGMGFAPGVIGQGFLLDGSDDYVRIPDSTSLHFGSELTVEMWFKREDSSSVGVLIDKRDLNNCNYGIIMSDTWGFQLYYNAGSGFQLSFSSMPAPGVFHHVAGTFRQADVGHVELKTYLDGQLARTDTLPGNLANSFNGTALAIGTARDGVDGYFRGVIDEVALYNYALNAGQIFSNYSAVVPTPPPPPPPPSTNSSGSIVALWHGDLNAQDSIGSSHGTLIGGVGFAPGISGAGFLLDGVNDYIRVPDNASLHLSGELSVEMWFKREDAASVGVLIDKRNLFNCNFGVIMSADWGLQLYYNDPGYHAGNSYEISFSALPSPGVFHHLVATYRQVDASHVELKTYLDGQLVRSDTLGGNLASTFNGDALAIGSGRDGVDGFFRGVIDEVAIYDYALSPAQVSSNFVNQAMIAPQIITQPASLTIVHGDSATFSVAAAGTPPLRYHWRFAGNNLSSETNSSVTIPAAEASNAGDYTVVIANDYGSVTSAVATLTVSQSGLPPSFVSAPASTYVANAGTTLTLSASVSGTPPFTFQWTFGGVEIPGATNISLVLSNIQQENAGIYRLAVTNDYDFILSAGSTLTVNESSGGTLTFNNFSINPVFDVDGVTRLSTSNGYVAAFSAGPQTNALTPLSGTAAFVLPGRFFGGMRHVPFMAPGQPGFAQVRVWDSTVSATYEEAVALGAKHGASTVFPVNFGGGIAPPGNLSAMASFSLDAGTGVAARRKARTTSVRPGLSVVSRSNNAMAFILSGPAGATLAIESSTNLVDWVVLDHVVNNSGAVTFTDTTAGSTYRFYRARVVSP